MDDPNFPSIELTNTEGISVPVGHCEICYALVAAYDEDTHRAWHAAMASGPIVSVRNLWAKDLLVGDVITAMESKDTRYGEINAFTVNRAKSVQDAETNRKKVAKAERNAHR